MPQNIDVAFFRVFLILALEKIVFTVASISAASCWLSLQTTTISLLKFLIGEMDKADETVSEVIRVRYANNIAAAFLGSWENGY